MVYTLLSHAYHMTSSCDLWHGHGHMILSCTSSLCSKSKKENINNNLAILPSYDNRLKVETYLLSWSLES